MTQETVADKIALLEAVADKAASNEAISAEARGRVRQRVDRQLARLREYPPGEPLLDLPEALSSALLSPVERAVVRWQHRVRLHEGRFWEALWDALDQADEDGLDRLALGWPDEVEAIRRWRGEDGFADHVRGLPIRFSL